MLRSKLCEKFLKHNEVNNCSIISDSDEGSFTSGRDCCKSLPTNTYECNGYSSKHKKVFELGDICGDCIQYFYNGEDSDV